MKKNARGQVIVESALAVSVFILLLLGTIEFARAFLTWQAVSAAAHEGARRGVVLGSDSGVAMDRVPGMIETYVRSNHSGGLNPEKLSVQTDWPDGGNEPGMRVRVSVSHPFDPVIPLGGIPAGFNSVSQLQIIR